MAIFSCCQVVQLWWTTLCVVQFLLIHSLSGLRLTFLRVPESRPAGYDVRLSCDFDPEGDSLYTVRWFHNGKEFYRFSPGEDPSAMFFPSRGINLDVEQSCNTSVVLLNLNVYSAGLFRCEVLADAPHFHTVTAEAFMLVGEFYNAANCNFRCHDLNFIVTFGILAIFFLEFK